MTLSPRQIESSLTGNIRNSSIELLRLISMFMIVACHFVMGNRANGASGLWISEQPLSFTKFFYQVICRGGGWFGNIVFFTISVWFLIDKNITVKNFTQMYLDSRKRITVLEYHTICRHGSATSTRNLSRWSGHAGSQISAASQHQSLVVSL